MDPNGLMVIAAVLGVLFGADDSGWRTRQVNVIFLSFAALMAFLVSHGGGGFLPALLMPIGAYKVARVVTEPCWAWWRRREAAHEAAQMGSKPEP